MNKTHNYLIYIVLAIITFIAFEPVIHNGFINFDDDIYIYQNSHITSGLKVENIVWAFTNIHAYNYHPLTSMSHILDCQLYGLNPGAHHFTNLLIHIANALLLFTVLSRMTKRVWASAFVVALFALHPMHVESVAWASERKDTLSAFFWMLTLLFYSYYTERQRAGYYLSALLAFSLGLLSKPMVVTLPFVLLLLDYWPLGRFQTGQVGRRVIEKIPFFAISAILSFVTYMVQRKVELVKTLSSYSLPWRIENAIVSYVIYIGKMFWPVRMSIFYPHPQGSIPLWQAGGAILILLVITFLALWKLRQKPYIAVGWLWFLGTLVPVIGIFQVGLQGYADRYSYIPYIGLFIIIVWTVSDIPAQSNWRKVIFCLSAVIIFSALGVKTWIQAGYWHNNESLYKHSIDAVENNWWAHEMLGNAYVSMDSGGQAVIEYKQTLQIDPENVGVQHSLARVYLETGDANEAVKLYENFLLPLPQEINEPDAANESLSPNLFSKTHSVVEQMYINTNTDFAIALARQGNIDEAARRYKEVLRISPDSLTAHRNLGDIFYQKGQIDRAVKQYAAVIQLEPNSAAEYKQLARALGHSGRLEESAKICQMIYQLFPNDYDACNGLGIVFAQQGKLAEAAACFGRSITIEPNFSGGYVNLGYALNLQGKSNEAIDCYVKAIKLDGQAAQAHCRLGQILAEKGELDKAIGHFNQALQINPNYKEARVNLDNAQAAKQRLENKQIKQ